MRRGTLSFREGWERVHAGGRLDWSLFFLRGLLNLARQLMFDRAGNRKTVHLRQRIVENGNVGLRLVREPQCVATNCRLANGLPILVALQKRTSAPGISLRDRQ
jgi:hypothetical protein